MDDARGRGRLQQRQQPVRQQESREVVHRKSKFMTVGAGLPAGSFVLRADPGIADQHVEPRVAGQYRLCKLTHTSERRQVGRIELWRLVPGSLDLADQRVGRARRRAHGSGHERPRPRAAMRHNVQRRQSSP